jgi:hypothetical protein
MLGRPYDSIIVAVALGPVEAKTPKPSLSIASHFSWTNSKALDSKPPYPDKRF